MPSCPGSYNNATGTNCVEEVTLPSGRNYAGEVKDDKRSGQGSFTFPEGEFAGQKYVGEFKDGKRNGQGTSTFPNGGKYVGEFRDDKRSGRGIEYRPDGSILRSGIWGNGVFRGR